MKRTRILSAAAALLFIATAAQAQHEQDDRHSGQDQHAQASSQEQQRHSNDDRGRAAPAQQRGVEQRGVEQRGIEQRGVEQRGVEQRGVEQRGVEQRGVEQRGVEQRGIEQRGVEQRGVEQRGVEQRGVEQRAAVQEQRRAVQNEEQQRYQQSRQREQGEQFDQAQGRQQLNDRDRDYRPGYDFRYNVGDAYRETNQFGVNVLRQALSIGYQQGYRAGLLDRRDGDPADYQRAFAPEDAGYGYTGTYVPESDYAYYLREGFQRGYDDAYWNRARYGTLVNGNAVILGDIVSGILGLTSIR